MPTVDVSGSRIGYRRRGSGQPLLLLHSAFSDSREWNAQLAGLSDVFDVIAMDCPGCGLSDDPPEGFTLERYADIVAGFLSALGIGQAHIGGLSFGSLCALVVYRHHPRLVRSLLLASAYAGWAGSLPPEEVAARKRWALSALERPVDEWGEEFLATVFSETTPMSAREEAMEILRSVRPEGFRPVAMEFLDVDLRDVLPLIVVPTLLLYGELDVRSPLTVAADMQARISGSRLEVIPGVGHGSNTEAPEAFNAAARDFLLGVRR